MLDKAKLLHYINFKRHCIDFCVDKDIVLQGVRMIGSENNDYVAMVNVTDVRQRSSPMISKSGVFSSVFIRFHSKFFVYCGFNFLFGCSVDLKKNVRYRVTAIIDGPAPPRGHNFKNP